MRNISWPLIILLFISAAQFACESPPKEGVQSSPTPPHYEQFPETPPIPFQGEILDFYSTKDPYGEFSNFALFPVFVDDQWWSTSEHYFQSRKYEKPELIEWVRRAKSPREAALRGRDPNIPKRTDWEQVRDGFMEKAVQDKFARYPKLMQLLRSTGRARIFEHTKNDCYWGDCGDRTGKNKLGLLLEKIRAAEAAGN